MSTYLNEVNLIGRVGKEVIISKTTDGKTIASFSLATSEFWTDKNTNERKERTDWHKIVIYNPKLAEIAQNYIKSGNLLFISGKLRYEKWKDPKDPDEKEHWKTSIILDLVNSKLINLSPKSMGNDDNDEPSTRRPKPEYNESNQNEDNDFPF